MTRLPGPLKPLWPYAKVAYTLATGAVARPAMRLSALRDGWLPTSIAASTADAVLGARTGSIHHLADGETILRAAPTGTPPEARLFRDQREVSVPPRRVLELAGGRVLGPHRALITSAGALLHDEVRYFGTSRGTQHPLFLDPGVGAPTELDGSVGVLATRGDANYYHFLHDVIPRIASVEEGARRGELAAPDRWYVPAGRSFQRQLLELAGIPAERVINSDDLPHVRAENLIVPTLPDLDLNHPRWPVDFLRSRLLPAGSGVAAGSRIYVTRGDVPHTRVVLDEASLLAELEPMGFRVVDPGSMTVVEQVAAFAGAEMIVAPHGAALANLVFAGAGATVVELFPPDFVQACYWKLSTQVDGLRYRYFLGTGRVPGWRAGKGVTSDIRIDVRSLVSMVTELIDLPG